MCLDDLSWQFIEYITFVLQNTEEENECIKTREV
jgi:hypothetical protein